MVVLLAIAAVAVLGMVAFAVDLGYVVTVQTELRRACDSGALAGASMLADGIPEAQAEVRRYVQLNRVGGRDVDDLDMDIDAGVWNPQTRSFTATDELPSAIRVRLARNDQPLFFGRIFGRDSFDVEAESIAMYQPRDIVLVLDYSGSMNDDSALSGIARLGRGPVEANMAQIYAELGSPTFGNMQFTPEYISSTNNTVIKQTLGLTNEPYPYPGGSWDDYINHVKNDAEVNNAGYRRYYGYLTWVDYLQAKRASYNDTPVLWRTSEQPVTALKDGVDVFVSFLQEADTEDRLGLAVYNAANGAAVLESPLTQNLSSVADIVRHRQAGHYDAYTNIGAGLAQGRAELQSNARVGAFKMVVLMTDGVANRPSNPTAAAAYVRSEAAACAAAGIPVVTISLGGSADVALMQEVADTTGGIHFNVPGGQTIEDLENQLKDVFRSIADQKPLKLVK